MSPVRTKPVGQVAFGRVAVEAVVARSVLTPTSGFMSQYDFTLNPYSGCTFGCDYCYARFFAPSADQRASWGQWVAVKTNACELVTQACRRRMLKSGDKVYLSSVTDPYQPIEKQLGLTRAILTAILDSGMQPRLTVQTRSPVVTRDIDLFRQFDRLRVNVTVTTDSEEVRRRYEPHSPSIAARFKALKVLASAGIEIGVSISPMLPIVDVESFAVRLATLNAAEYVTQYLKAGRSRFASGTSIDAARRLREDGWGQREYQKAREMVAKTLGIQKRLLEGVEGYAPA
jgi:DNA repair photolyase